jgi:hypothetical protein
VPSTAHNTVFPFPFRRGEKTIATKCEAMAADVFVDRTEGGGIEISVVQHGLSAGAARKYDTVGKAGAVLLAFEF